MGRDRQRTPTALPHRICHSLNGAAIRIDQVRASFSAVMFVAVSRVSPDYFVSDAPLATTWRGRHPVVRFLGHVVKNALGLFLLIIGLAMLVLPGQGMLTIVVALMLLDFPGKRRLTLRILRERHLRSGINWIRAKAKQAPLILPDPEHDP